MSKSSWVHKLKMAALVSVMVVGAHAATAFANPEPNPNPGPSPSPETVGNTLPMQFNVSEVEYNNLVKLSWVGGGTSLENFDVKQSIAHTVNYNVDKGSDYTTYSELEDQVVDIWLQITANEPEKMEGIKVGGSTVSATNKGGSTYYLMMDDVVASDTMTTLSGSFDITFNAVTGGTPFTASLVAMVSDPKPAPQFLPMESNADGNYTITFTPAGQDPEAMTAWFNAFNGVEMKVNGEYVSYQGYTVDPINQVITITHAYEDDNHDYRFKSTGYDYNEYTWYGMA